MNRIFTCFLVFLCLIATSLPPAQADNPPSPAQTTFRQDKLAIHTSGGDRHFTIEIAETPAQQELGLMYRKALPRDHGMLFIWDKDAPIAMWMKNTLIPLDMAFIDSHGRIVYIAANATPESIAIISAGQPVRAVLELTGGTADLDGIRVGDKVIHSYFTP